MLLPAVIRVPGDEERIVITLSSGSHRIKNIEIAGYYTLTNYQDQYPMAVAPVDSLWHLPTPSGEVSFFETGPPRRGYVKNNAKHLERILMSWWTLDWYVGRDKALGLDGETSTILYTSLKFWHRKNSDLQNFVSFLHYWGWRL